MSKFLLHCWAILLLTFGLSACSVLPSELTTAEKLIETAPDSALHILQHIPASKLRSDKNRALYGLLMFETLGKKKLPMKPDSLLDFSIDYYSNHPDGNRLASCYLYKGRTYKYTAQYEKAMQYYLKALDEIKDSKDNVLLGRINFDMGDIHNIQGDYKIAREKYQKAIIHFKESKFQAQSFYSVLNIGRTYHDEKNYIHAQRYYRTIISEAKDSIQLGALYQEMGLNFYDSKKLDSALLYYNKVIMFPFLGRNKSIRYYMLSKIYFDMNKIDLSYQSAKNSLLYDNDIRVQRECYRIMANCDFKRRNTKNVTTYMNKYVVLGDSIRKIDAQAKASYMETTHSARKEADKNRLQKWISWTLLIVFVICFVFAGRYIVRKMKKEKQEIIETHTGEKVDIHKKVIDDKRAGLQLQIETRKKPMQAEFKHAGSAEREKQLRNIYKELLHYDEPELFYKEMDKFLNGVVTKLKNRFSTLNENELKLCCYLLLHIPTYDMIILFGYNSDVGLKSLKGRLAKRLQVKNAAVIEEFLLTLLAEN